MTASSNGWPDQTRLPDAGSMVEICRAMKLILAPGQVTEVRALGVSTPEYRRPHIESGYFDDIEALASAASELTRYASGVYYIPNIVNPALLARAANRTRPINGESLTSDRDIIARRWLLIDIDAKRPSGICSSDKEHEAAITKARQIRTELTKRGWPQPILADSCNGGHLMYRLDLPVADDELVKRILEGLALMFDDEHSQVDTAVFNPARIWKLPGTFGRKGDDAVDRPHRMARILETPEGALK
jgi:hypothetical protein